MGNSTSCGRVSEQPKGGWRGAGPVMEALLLMSNGAAPFDNWMSSGRSRAMGPGKESGRMATHAPVRDLGIDSQQLH